MSLQTEEKIRYNAGINGESRLKYSPDYHSCIFRQAHDR